MMFTPQHKLRLQTAIDRWQGTPYVAGQSMPGKDGGVDCVRYDYDLLEWTYQVGHEPLPRIAQDAAFHKVEVVQAVMRHFWERFQWFSVKPGLPLMPADLLAVRQKTPYVPEDEDGRAKILNPHHVFVVGPDRIMCHDSWPGIGVRSCGIGGVRASFEVVHVYRSRLAYAPPR